MTRNAFPYLKTGKADIKKIIQYKRNISIINNNCLKYFISN